MQSMIKVGDKIRIIDPYSVFYGEILTKYGGKPLPLGMGMEAVSSEFA